MAEDKHDMLDDLIGIRRDLQAMQSPLDTIADALVGDENAPVWDASLYKDRPRGNTTKCIRLLGERDSLCSACVDVCPVDAISFVNGKIEVDDSCRMCGLCISACPTEAMNDTKHPIRKLYDEIARKAAAHNTCYLTCTRALGRLPQENEVVLPCVGILWSELLCALLIEYPNLAVYLPAGICDKCRTTTGEAAYISHIGAAEEWSGRAMGIAMDEEELDHDKKRSYERQEFVGSLVGGAQAALAASNPMLAGAAAITKRISDHTRKINELERSLDAIVGSSTTTKKRRTLPRKRQMLMGALQKAPQLAERVPFMIPVCDSTACTACGDCARVCPFNACDIDASGRFSVADVYCVGCNACVEICPEGALVLAEGNHTNLVIPDKETEARQAREAERAEQLAKLKEEGRKKVLQGLDILEKLAPAENDDTGKVDSSEEG